MEIKLPANGWSPRDYQRPLWDYLSKGGKRAVLRGHRRCGKDEVFLHHMACAAHERVGNFWYMLPEASMARKAMWDAVNPNSGMRRIDEAFPQELRAATRDNEMMIVFNNGSTFQIVGSDNFNSLIGSPPIGLVFSEYAVANPTAWAYLMPILEENGGWAGFNSTPRGKNHFKDMCELAESEPDWFYQTITVDDTAIFSQEQLQRILRQLQKQYGEEYGHALWRQEYYVSFDAAIPGAIWADCIVKAENEGRILDFEVSKQGVVNTGWDLGRTDSTAIWFHQNLGRQIDVFDHHESNMKDIPFYVELLLEKRREHGITYGIHWLPHDARPRTLAAGGKSILQQFNDAARKYPELGRFAICKRLDRQEGIQAARATFPLCRFHKSRTALGVEHLRAYHREWDEELQMFKDSPKHDFTSHSADAWRCVGLTWKIRDPDAPETPLLQRLLGANPVKQTFGAMKEKHLARMRSRREELM